MAKKKIKQKEFKTGREWMLSVPKEYKLMIMDFDGWTLKEFDSEKISKEQFIEKLMGCTISCNASFSDSEWYKDI